MWDWVAALRKKQNSGFSLESFLELKCFSPCKLQYWEAATALWMFCAPPLRPHEVPVLVLEYIPFILFHLWRLGICSRKIGEGERNVFTAQSYVYLFGSKLYGFQWVYSQRIMFNGYLTNSPGGKRLFLYTLSLVKLSLVPVVTSKWFILVQCQLVLLLPE